MSREIAILIDGGFFTKRLPRLVGERHRNTPENVVGSIRFMCHRHVEELILDPLWQRVNDDLYEHIDGLQSGLPRPTGTAPAAQEEHLKDPA